MSINNQNTFLNIEDAHLRLRTGNLYAQGINIGGITVDPSHGLQRVSDTGNVTSNTLQFANATTAFVTTANVTVGRDLTVTGNATVSSNLTVTGNAVISDDLTVTENLLVSNNLTVTGNTFYTNPASVLVDSNVVTEYTGPHDRPLRKYPEVAMTSASQGGYVVTPSTQNATHVAYHMFDGDRSTRWTAQGSTDSYDSLSPYQYNGSNSSSISDTSGTPHDGAFLKLELPTAIKLDYTIIRENTDPATRTPGKITFLGSTNGTDWTFLKEFSGMSNTALDETYIINDTNYYNHFAFVVKNLSDGDGVLDLGEWELYGHEEGSGSLDTTLKSVYNVPATTGTQLEVYYDAKDLTAMPSTVTDLSPNSNGGSVAGATLDETGGIESFRFDGNDYISTTVTGLTGTSVTMSVWVNVNSIDTSRINSIVGLGAYPGSGSSIWIAIDGSQRFYTGISGLSKTVENSSAFTNNWVHLTMTIGTGELALYQDATIIGKVSGVTFNPDSNPVLYLGTRSDGSGNPESTRYFTGSIANFRLYSKALNADQIKELYDYQKDYFLGSKSQVTLYKGHLGVGVTEPSGQLELAGDERIQEYPPGPMDGYETLIPGHGVFCWYTPYYYQGNFETHSGVGMYAKDEGTTGWYGPYNGNSGYTGGNVYAGTDFAATSSSGLGFNDAYGTRYYGAWTTFKLPYKINLKRLRIRQWGTAESINSRCAPEDGVILGSNDGTKWYHVHTFTGLQYGGSAGSYSFSAVGEYVTINCNTDYNQYVLITTRTLHYAFTVIIGELQWFGTPGPTTLDKGSLTLGRSLDVPRVSRYDVDTETPRPEKLVADFDTTVNSSPIDISGQGNHGTFKGTNMNYSSAYKAFVFNGTDDYIQSSGVTLPTAHSMSVWFNMDSDQSGINSIMHIGTFNTGDESRIFTSGNILNATIYGSTIQYDTSLSPGNWYHVVYTFTDGTTFNTTNAKIYVNGQLIPTTQTQTAATLNLVGNTVTIGATSSGAEAFKGKISNPKLYSVVLEPSEVKKLYNLGRTGRSMVISDTAVGIGKVPEAQLDVRGNLNVDGVITTPQRPVFYAYKPGGAAADDGYTGIIEFTHTRINVGGCFNTSDYKFYAPITGYYWFEFQVLARYGTGNGNIETSLYKNGVNIASRALAYAGILGDTDHDNICFSIPVQMNAGDNIYPGIHDCASGVNAYYGEDLAHFSGYFIG